jgi:anti-sigma regulatory factor (Ser/Thr protein kinase)
MTASQGPRLLVLDLDPPWRAEIERVANEGDLGSVRFMADPSKATAAVSYSPDIVLWNLADIRQFNFRLQDAVLAAFPQADVLVAVDGATEEAVVGLLKAGVTYLCDKKDGPGSFGQTFLRLVGLNREVRALAPSLRVDYQIRNWVEISAPSEKKFVESLARFVLLLTRTRVADRKRRSLGYALREIGQNAIEWGNAYDPRKRFHLSFCVLEDRLLLKLEDEGEGFDPEALIDVREDPLGNLIRRREQGKRTGGYGLAIVRGLMDQVIFSEKGNAVVLVLSLDPVPVEG